MVDRNLGEGLATLARSFHVWVVESPSNTPAIQRFWTMDRLDPNAGLIDRGITSFAANEGESVEEMCVRIAEDIDEHHGEFAHDPPWTEIEVFGVPLSKRLEDVFIQLGATHFEPSREGFICRR